VFIHHQIPLNQLILDVKHGIGPIKNVLPVQTTGFSILKEPVFQLLTYVPHTMLQELVFHALSDMI
jgi:hypothetical protein